VPSQSLIFVYSVYIFLLAIVDPIYELRNFMNDDLWDKQSKIIAVALTILAVFQIVFFSVEPIDSDLILYEQSINISCDVGLPRVE
jgi:hypothetical protein